jgi:hypothetical protein
VEEGHAHDVSVEGEGFFNIFDADHGVVLVGQSVRFVLLYGKELEEGRYRESKWVTKGREIHTKR